MKKFNWKETFTAFGWFFLYFIIATLLYGIVRPWLQKLPLIGKYVPLILGAAILCRLVPAHHLHCLALAWA